MTLTRKASFWIVLLVGGVLSLGLLSVWNLLSLYQTANGAIAEYNAMDRAEALAPQIKWLHDVLASSDAGTYREVRLFTPLRTGIERTIEELTLAQTLEDGQVSEELNLARLAADRADAAFHHFTGGVTIPENGKTTQPVSALNSAAAELAQAQVAIGDVAKMTPASARLHVTGAADRVRMRLVWTVLWLIVVLCASGMIHFSQYRALVRPLAWLRDDMKQSASTGYRELVRPRGDEEFMQVAGLFNGLARELADLYKSLEEKVISRSRELVRSERLASVGFLAAGVAHEINNPLSVISGYAELAAKGLNRVLIGDDGTAGSEAEAAAEAEALTLALDAQQIIRDEAFRCKEITGRLLALSRGGSEAREPLRLDELAQQVTVLTKGLRNYRDRRVVLDFAAGESLDVVGNPVELKQVLLNLTVNALEAVPDAGEVRIGGQRSGDWVELSVQDNGRGMTAETLEQIFEPFFTAKRGAGEPGTGLGLSITYAIVENHGGRIRAESKGPGHGSRFIVCIPGVKPAEQRAATVAF
ncbi:MAG: fixL 3 [Phycisphaerales bacterium]|nr:fixL 3 [Phycisphaerales bacterium]